MFLFEFLSTKLLRMNRQSFQHPQNHHLTSNSAQLIKKKKSHVSRRAINNRANIENLFSSLNSYVYPILKICIYYEYENKLANFLPRYASSSFEFLIKREQIFAHGFFNAHTFPEPIRKTRQIQIKFPS